MNSLRVPIFQEHLQVESVAPQGVFLSSEDGLLWLGGAVYCGLARLMDGRRTMEDIVEALAGQYGSAQVYYALDRLERSGCLAEAAPDVPPAQAALWRSLGMDPGQARKRLAEAEVEVLRLGEAPAEPVLEAFRAEGVRVREGGAALRVVVVDDYLRAPLAGLNEEALRSGRPWVLLRPNGRMAWLGPHFVPGRSACWACLAQRLRANRPLLTLLRQHRAGEEPLLVPRATSEGTARAAAHLLASVLARGLVTGEDGLTNTLVTLDGFGPRTEHHAVVRRPQCPACGDPGLVAARQQRPLLLESRPKVFSDDGGHRLTGPEETLRQYQRHVSPLTGVVQRLEQLHGGEGEPALVVDAGPNLALSSGDPQFFRRMLRGRSAGKGMTLAQARASGLCEAIERYCGVFQGDEARRTATYRSLDGEAIHPHRLLGFSERQYLQREAWNATCAARSRVPHPFDEDRAVDWSPAWSLTQQTRRWVPTAYCYYDVVQDGLPFCQADSNGCAAGHGLEEAILQGFLELAERDGVALWWYNRVRRPRVDLESFGEPYFQRLLDYYRSLGRELWVLDLTTDLGIPIFAALSRERSGPSERILLGFGAHLEARLGIARALTEMNQFLPYRASGAEGTLVDPEFLRWFETATLAGQPYLAPAEELPPVSAAHHGRRWSEDLRDDVEACVERARRLGLETLVVDQTRPDVGLTVVKVMVPGLCHMWQRFGPRRLYEVPVRLGWLSQPTPEEQLNPIGIFF
jgi:ribosomal protein S12 methylthiotransferase accessory factor